MSIRTLRPAPARRASRRQLSRLLAVFVAIAGLLFAAAALAADEPPFAPPPPAEVPGEAPFDIQVEGVIDEIVVDVGFLEAEGAVEIEAMEGDAVEEAALDVDLVVDVGVANEGVADQKKAEGDDWDDELEPEVAAAAQPRFVVNDETFDQWMFNQLGNAQKATERFHSTLNVQVDSIAAACELAPEQKQKLLLAGRGDINRFFDQVEICRKKFDKVKTDQNRINEIFQDIQPLQLAAMSGLFGEKSLFEKVVKRTLNDEQSLKMRQVEQERRQYQFKAKIELVVAALDDTIAMRAAQRKELVAMLLETPLPKRYGPYDSYLMLYKISRLPEEKVKKLLDPPQWRALDKQLEQARQLEQFLRQQGLLSEDEPAR